MGRRTERWIADDGKEFNTREDMLRHELLLIDEKEIAIFVADKPQRRQKEYAKLLLEWQNYRRNQDTSLEDVRSYGGAKAELAEFDFAALEQALDVLPPRDYAFQDEDDIEASFARAAVI